MKKKSYLISLSLSLICFCHPGSVAARDLSAGVGNLPPHAIIGEGGRPEGGFVEVVRAIDRVYLEGDITIRVLPTKRSLTGLANGTIDFHIPYIPNPQVSDEALPFSFVSEPVVDVVFILYTRSDKETPSVDLLARLSIETIRGAEPHFPFQIKGIDSFRQGLLRVSAGRSDGFIGEQDACDFFIRQRKMSNIRRTLYAKWESSILIGKSAESKEIDRILSNALRELKQTGELQKITATIHHAFEDWQPYLTDWLQGK